MTQDSWQMFPRNLEQKINSLLDEAEPNTLKAFQLYKNCKAENLWKNSFELFQLHLTDFFKLSKPERAKSYFDQFLERPMSRFIFDEFELNFRTAHIDSENLITVADWAHNLIKKNCLTDCIVISVDILTKTLQHITSPPPHEKSSNIEFEDFCIAWKIVVFKIFGKEYDQEVQLILKELRLINRNLKEIQITKESIESSDRIYLTQSEIDWTIAVQSAAFDEIVIPKFPLSRKTDKIHLENLKRTTQLFNIIIQSDQIDLQKYRELVKNTLLHQCSALLKNRKI